MKIFIKKYFLFLNFYKKFILYNFDESFLINSNIELDNIFNKFFSILKLKKNFILEKFYFRKIIFDLVNTIKFFFSYSFINSFFFVNRGYLNSNFYNNFFINKNLNIVDINIFKINFNIIYFLDIFKNNQQFFLLNNNIDKNFNIKN
jgi:hypothetical protein